MGARCRPFLWVTEEACDDVDVRIAFYVLSLEY